MNTKLFSPIKIRSLEIKNRIVLSPMCMYSAEQGVASAWHLVHLGARAAGGCGLILTEATAVSPEGRITPGCLGLWNKEQTLAMKPIVDFVHNQNSKIGIQLAHAGRKASCAVPWQGGLPLSKQQGGWQTIAPSLGRFNEKYPDPKEMTVADIEKVVTDFRTSAEFAKSIDIDVLELHMAHGYLLHSFISPLSNFRTDEYGGSLENRMRLPTRIVKEVRKVWGESKPLFARISASDWMPNGVDVDEAIQVSKMLKAAGVDLIDCSSGGLLGAQKIELSPGYQVGFSEKISKEAEVLTGAVGLIETGSQAEDILQKEKADLIFIGRALLRNPHWALAAATEIGAKVVWPDQYLRAQS